jgi:hypothetical protein
MEPVWPVSFMVGWEREEVRMGNSAEAGGSFSDEGM